MRETSPECIKPLRQTRFTLIYLLPSTDKAYNYGPIVMTIHRLD